MSKAELVGVAEIAQMLGVSRQRVNRIVQTHLDFPTPAAELSAGRIWWRRDIARWISTREDVGSRGRKAPGA